MDGGRSSDAINHQEKTTSENIEKKLFVTWTLILRKTNLSHEYLKYFLNAIM